MTQINLFMKQKQTQGHRKHLWLLEGKGGRKGKKLGVLDQQCKLLHIKETAKPYCIAQGIYSYPVTSHNGKEHQKEYASICTTESLCCPLETNTTMKINYSSILKNTVFLNGVSIHPCSKQHSLLTTAQGGNNSSVPAIITSTIRKCGIYTSKEILLTLTKEKRNSDIYYNMDEL